LLESPIKNNPEGFAFRVIFLESGN